MNEETVNALQLLLADDKESPASDNDQDVLLSQSTHVAEVTPVQPPNSFSIVRTVVVTSTRSLVLPSEVTDASESSKPIAELENSSQFQAMDITPVTSDSASSLPLPVENESTDVK